MPKVVAKIKEWVLPTEFYSETSEYRRPEFSRPGNRPGSWQQININGMRLKKSVTYGLEKVENLWSLCPSSIASKIEVMRWSLFIFLAREIAHRGRPIIVAAPSLAVPAFKSVRKGM
jgi:hypothetical protein